MYRIKEFFQKHKKPILIGLAIILILLIIFFMVPWGQKEEEAAKSPILGAELAEQPIIVRGSITQKEQEESSASIVAKNFTEIYGSYSNQSNYANIESSLPLLSASFKARMSAFLKTSRATYVPATEYSGVTVVVIGTTIESMNETAGTATILLKTQRKESVGAQANYTVKYQDIRLTLVKEGGVWLVASAKWEE
ncbi:hypothetical protein KJ885_05265 [Patescibacteria group bacterium]|nr:hypothetical protein [Patescibacteria group bacterium]